MEPRDLVVYKNKLYLLANKPVGSNQGGKIFEVTSTGWSELNSFPSTSRPLRATVWGGYMWISTYNDDHPNKHARIYRWAGPGSALVGPYVDGESTEFKHYTNLKVFNGALYVGASENWVSPGNGALFVIRDPDNPKLDTVVSGLELSEVWGMEVFRGSLYFGSKQGQTNPAGFIYEYREGLEWYVRKWSNGSTYMRGFGWNGVCPADYDGDGNDDLALFDSPSGTWWIKKTNGGFSSVQSSNFVKGTPVPADYDGDGKADLAVYHPKAVSGKRWYILRSSNGSWKQSSLGGVLQTPVSADYDGDGVADVAVFVPKTAEWKVLESSTSTLVTTQHGVAHISTPLPADYDGDGSAEYAVVYPDSSVVGAWKWSVSGQPTFTYGVTNSIPYAADFDGDGVADVAVCNLGAKTFDYFGSSVGAKSETFPSYVSYPVPADYDGDGGVDVAGYDSVGEFVRVHTSGGGTWQSLPIGLKGKEPVPADYDGDGKADFAARDIVAKWRFLNGDGFTVASWGPPYRTDYAVPNDYDNDGKDDIGVYYPPTGMWNIYRSSLGSWSKQFGYNGTLPVDADYDGDGYADTALYYPPNGKWHLDKSSEGYYAGYLSNCTGMLPVPTDFEGDGKDNISLYDNGSGSWHNIRSDNYAYENYTYGFASAEPVPADYDGDGVSDSAVRGPNSTWYIYLSGSGSVSFQFGW